MSQEFTLPVGLIGRFAIVKLWPGIKTAEDECIARLKSASSSLGIECIEIHADGSLLTDPKKTIGRNDVDFVLHLHYDTPKFYDAFSFVALWNPLRFYHDWGYQRTSRNLITHDDFISCSAVAADNHVARLVHDKATHLPPLFNIYHSIGDVVHGPSLGDQKLFYAGINWEALNGGKSRHQEVLKSLDKTGLMRIYGPKVFQKVNVWEGYQSYVREIPFDGISMLDEISKAGIALVLSSPAHKESELMSNRLFESIAAGALIICDENKFASKYFGDSLLYIDSRCSVEEIVADIERHLAWARQNPDAALAMIVRAQAIFREKFTLVRNIRDLYEGFNQRKAALAAHLLGNIPRPKIKLAVHFMAPEFSPEVLGAHVASLAAQTYREVQATLVIDHSWTTSQRNDAEAAFRDVGIHIALVDVDFFEVGPTGKNRTHTRLGKHVLTMLGQAGDAEAVVFVAPNERLYSNHLQVLAGALMRDPEIDCVATASIVTNKVDPIHAIHERIDFNFLNIDVPVGYARFAFRLTGLSRSLDLALPFLNQKALAALVGKNKIHQQIPATVVLDSTRRFPYGVWTHDLEGLENEVIGDFAPKALKVYLGFVPHPPAPAGHVHVAPAPVPYSRFTWKWVSHQYRSLKATGLSARIDVLRQRLGMAPLKRTS
jgi:hypothetical protein